MVNGVSTTTVYVLTWKIIFVAYSCMSEYIPSVSMVNCFNCGMVHLPAMALYTLMCQYYTMHDVRLVSSMIDRDASK